MSILTNLFILGVGVAIGINIMKMLCATTTQSQSKEQYLANYDSKGMCGCRTMP